MSPAPSYAVAFVPRHNTILGIAYRFLPSNVNLPWGSIRLDESPIEAAFRLTYEQTHVKPEEAIFAGKLEEGLGVSGPTYVYLVTKFSGRPIPSSLGRAFWASEAQLLRQTADHQALSCRVMTLLHRL